jgi:class 3 adenylate cyclase
MSENNLDPGLFYSKETIQGSKRKIRWSIRQKIMAIMISLIILLITVTISSTIKLIEIKHEIVDVAEFNVPITNLFLTFREFCLEQELYLQRIFKVSKTQPIDFDKIRYETEEFKRFGRHVNRGIKKIDMLVSKAVILAEVDADILFYKLIQKQIKLMEIKYQEFDEQSKAILDLRRAGKTRLAEELEFSLGKTTKEVNVHIINILSELQNKVLNSVNAAKQHEEYVFFFTFLVTLLAVIIGIFYARMIVSGLVRPIKELSLKITEIGQGNLDLDIPLTSKDEIGQLTDNFNYMVKELRQKEKILEAFGKYVDPRIVKALINDDHIVTTDGTKQEMSIIFAGVSGLDNLNQEIPAKAITTFYNEYLEKLGEAISINNGVLDKFIGTVAMGYWGPPFTDINEHSNLALKASSNLIDVFPDMQTLLKSHLGTSYVEGNNELTIGIATGEVFVGNIGSSSALSYTVMGGVVNNASRLKGASKQYGVKCLCTEETKKKVSSTFLFREIDEIIAAGMDEPIKIFECLTEQQVEKGYTEEAVKLYENGLKKYRNGEWDLAKKLWETFLIKVPSDKAVQIMLARIPGLRKRPQEAWAGVWHLANK